MRLIAAAALVLLPLTATAAQPVERGSPDPAEAPPAKPSFDRMNVYRQLPGCTPIEQQIARGERQGGTRLDQQPPGHAFLAVDRRVNGCQEVALVSEEQRRQRQGR